MALTQTNANDWSSSKTALESHITTLQNQIAIDDYIAYYNNKDNMYYFLRVVDAPTSAGGHPKQDIRFTASGIRFKLTNPNPIHPNVNITNVILGYIIYGGKDIYWMSEVGTGCENSSYPAPLNGGDSYIDYIELFTRQTFEIPVLLHNGSVSFRDDITEFTVLPGAAGASTEVSSGYDCIAGDCCYTLNPSQCVKKQDPNYYNQYSLEFHYRVTHGIARILMLNCIYSL